MNPQQFQQNPNTFYQQPTYAPVPVKSKVNKMLIILSAILFIAGASVSTYFMGNLSKKDSEIKEIQKQLSEAKAKLTETESQLASLGERKTGVEALQASNDETRKSDIAQFIAEVNMYVAENQGTFPSTEPSVFKDEFETPYLTNDLMEFNDPATGKRYTFTPVAPVQTPPGLVLGDIQYQWPATCAGPEFSDDATTRQAAARILLESGETYCIQN